MGDKTKENWRPIPGVERYSVSDSGRIRGPRGIRKPQAASSGHLYIVTYRRGAGRSGPLRSRKVWIHAAVLGAFIGPCPSGMEARHLDGNPQHNVPTNLAWGTRVENMLDKQRHGTQTFGESHPPAVLTEVDVREIREMHGLVSLRELASRYGVSHTAIRRAAIGVTWRKIDG